VAARCGSSTASGRRPLNVTLEFFTYSRWQSTTAFQIRTKTVCNPIPVGFSDVNWHTLCCDLKSHLGGITSAAPQPRVLLPADEINLCWSLARNEPLLNQMGRLPGQSSTVWRQVLLTRPVFWVLSQNPWEPESGRHDRSVPPASLPSLSV